MPLPDGAAPVLLSLLPLHAALHNVQNNGQLLADAVATAPGAPLALAVKHWPPVVAVLLVAGLLVIALLSGGAPRTQRPDARVSEGR